MTKSRTLPEDRGGICIVSGFDCLVVPSEGQVHYSDIDELLSSPAMSVYVCAACANCNQLYLLLDEDTQEVEVEARQMGDEVYYSADCWGTCESCKLELNIRVEFSH